MTGIKAALKAIVAALIAALAVLTHILMTSGSSHIHTVDWLLTASAALVTFNAVYFTPWRPAPTPTQTNQLTN